MIAELELLGAGGEPVDLRRTLGSHGVASLPPSYIDEEAWTLEVTLPSGRGARTVRVSEGRPGYARVEGATSSVLTQLRHMFRLNEDLSGCYAVARDDPQLAWAAAGAGRMLRSPTVFEDVVKTICTTNCTWSATERMVNALVGELGDPATGGEGPLANAFPTPERMAAAPESFYRETVRSGYRGAYLISLARSVASGELDLEALGAASREEVPDEDLEARLLALPGVGPYAAAHIMMTVGRHSRLILDSWTRPKYARLLGRKTVADATIRRRFRRFGPDAGLAFWLFVTRDWVE
jgi:3-methyladenine DNA glycosylase/8-oxoguanine DNA glycosylase